MKNQIVLLTGGERGAGPTVCLPHRLPSTQNVASTHSQQPSGRGRRWKEKPTRKPVTDITQTHTFGGETLKSIKQTTMSSLFLPEAEDTNAIVLLVFQHPIQSFQHCQRYFPRWLHCAPRVVTATFNYFCPVWMVPLENKESVLLWYLEEKHLNKPFLTQQAGTAFLSESRIQIPKQHTSVFVGRGQPNFQGVSVWKLEP